MRAVIVTADDAPAGLASLGLPYPAPLFPLVDRPFVQHIVESVAACGVTRFDFIVPQLPGAIDTYLGDGSRWGCRFGYHRAADAAEAYASRRPDGPEDDEEVLLGTGDTLPPLPRREMSAPGDGGPLLFCWSEGRAPGPEAPGHWTGWAVLAPRHLRDLAVAADADGRPQDFWAVVGEGSRLRVGAPLSMRDLPDTLSSHRAVLSREFAGLLIAGREVAPGVWLGRNSYLHPTARVSPPVYVGENCRVGRSVQLGPYATLVRDCLIDDGCTIANSVVLPWSYVGEALTLEEVIVDQGQVIDVKGHRAIAVHDECVLGSLLHRRLMAEVTGPVTLALTSTGRALLRPFLEVVALCRRQPPLPPLEVGGAGPAVVLTVAGPADGPVPDVVAAGGSAGGPLPGAGGPGP